MKRRVPASTYKKVVVLLLDRSSQQGYLDPAQLGRTDSIDLLSADGEHVSLPLAQIKSVYFVREFTREFEPERKSFFSRPKLQGLWVRLKFRDNDALEGVVPNNLLSILDHGIQITPPDLHGNSLRIFIPRSALSELIVLGVVGAGRRVAQRAAAVPAEPAPQRKLFGEEGSDE